MADKQAEKLIQNYSDTRPLYEGLTNTVHSTLESLIKNANIDYLGVTSRTKTVDSLSEKAQRKGYSKVEEITDLSGIRVITFIESDVTKVCDLIKPAFKVHPLKSLDKTDELGIDRFGHRSVHFVCDLGNIRTKLPEFLLYKGLIFEIQVRTVLQHAWAEIEHDRNYKFSGVLPTHIQRRLYLLAGMLEIVDREFVSVANEVDQYAKDVAQKTGSGNLDVEINSTSLSQYLPTKLEPFGDFFTFQVRDTLGMNEVIDELRAFGAEKLSDLDRMLNQKFLNFLKENEGFTSVLGLLRRAMIYSDVDRYFDLAWQQHWRGISDATKELIKQKYSQAKLRAILKLIESKMPHKGKPAQGKKRNTQKTKTAT